MAMPHLLVIRLTISPALIKLFFGRGALGFYGTRFCGKGNGQSEDLNPQLWGGVQHNRGRTRGEVKKGGGGGGEAHTRELRPREITRCTTDARHCTMRDGTPRDSEPYAFCFFHVQRRSINAIAPSAPATSTAALHSAARYRTTSRWPKDAALINAIAPSAAFHCAGRGPAYGCGYGRCAKMCAGGGPSGGAGYCLFSSQISSRIPSIRFPSNVTASDSLSVDALVTMNRGLLPAEPRKKLTVASTGCPAVSRM